MLELVSGVCDLGRIGLVFFIDLIAHQGFTSTSACRH